MAPGSRRRFVLEIHSPVSVTGSVPNNLMEQDGLYRANSNVRAQVTEQASFRLGAVYAPTGEPSIHRQTNPGDLSGRCSNPPD
jgi:hypothetical protein